jgi:16S rRNA A1518/A1519 N6-dimethyltransferase RsmA/KsgA/DIM1 with predicted DNA glycosylase/AP lyase activity
MKRHSFGQHYLVDPEVVRMMISTAKLDKCESVLEIGTGKGILTEKLVELCSRLDGYEVDPENYLETLARLGERNAFIHLADVFEERPHFDVLVSSLPYSRSMNFIEWISQAKYNRAVVLLQEDFVRKVLSPPGSRNYRAVSAIAQISSEISVIQRVKRSAFRPPPKVSSVLVTMKPKVRLSRRQVLGIKRLFSLRRKEVASALALLGLTGSHRNFERRRVCSLAPAEVCEILAGPEPT